MGTVAKLTWMCKKCGARVFRGQDGIWRHSRTGLARCPVVPGLPDRGTYADPAEKRRAA